MRDTIRMKFVKKGFKKLLSVKKLGIKYKRFGLHQCGSKSGNINVSGLALHQCGSSKKACSSGPIYYHTDEGLSPKRLYYLIFWHFKEFFQTFPVEMNEFQK